jgi:MYXO-CTERM domain-containing protein
VTLGPDGTLAGTPSAAGTYAFTVTATDVNGCHGQRSYSMIVCSPISISPATIADGTTQSAYNVTLAGSGGTPTYSFAITSGAAPAGLALASGGALTGTPTAGGDFTFTITATDANACTGTQSYSVHIDSCAGTLEPTTLPMAVTGVAYDATLSVSGGAAPISYAVTAGALPAGLALVSDRITGIPTGSGDASFTITATDALGCATSRMYTVTTTCAAITVAPGALDPGIEAQPYAATLTASGGAAPYTFSAAALPSGLALSADGMLSGEPDAPGDYTFTVIATDVNGCIGMIEYTLTVEPAHGHDGCGCAAADSSGGWTLILLVGAVLTALRRRRA